MKSYIFHSFSLSRAPFYAIRASLVLVDVLKERGLYKELAQLFIRMTAEVRVCSLFKVPYFVCMAEIS